MELRHRLRGGLSDFLLKPLEVRLGPVRLPTACGLFNPFRLVSLPATSRASLLSQRIQQTLSQWTKTPSQVVGLGIGMQGFVRSEQIREKVNPKDWDDPRTRLVAELLWPHLSESEFHLLRESEDLTSSEALAALHELGTRDPKLDDRHSLLVRHGLAVCWLNVAVAREAAFAAGQISNGLGYWDIALHYWSDLIADDFLWSYFEERAKAVGVPLSFVPEVRGQMPLFLSDLVARFARAYGQQGDSVACHRLLSVLCRSGFPEEVRQAAASAIVRGSFY